LNTITTLYKAGQVIQTETVAIGKNQYPTPTGIFFVRELAKPANPKGAYGAYAFGLSGYSNVLTKFGRGDGQIGIHGTNAPAALGSKASHGCVRVNNAGITKLAKTLPQGVVVDIQA
jgi:lipoprotein-anchoring transpeptidase ErfK/SrfK